MHITLSPFRMDAALILRMDGDVLTVNGVAYDFGPLPDGAILPREAVACDWLVSDVRRIEGEIHLTLALPHGPIPWPAPPEALVVTDPAPLHVTENGPIILPVFIPASVPMEVLQ